MQVSQLGAQNQTSSGRSEGTSDPRANSAPDATSRTVMSGMAEGGGAASGGGAGGCVAEGWVGAAVEVGLWADPLPPSQPQATRLSTTRAPTPARART